MRRLLFSALIVLTLLANCKPQPSSTILVETRECWVKPDEGVHAECFTISVPENRRQPIRQNNVIKLAVAVIHPEEDALEPVFILMGGPGEPTVFLLQEWTKNRLASLLNNRDVVLVDQRGTGFSTPSLNCKDDSITACRSRLVGQNIQLETYNTMNNAADFNDVRKALGYEKINLIAGSYGTHLGLAMIRDYPDGVRSAVLDGVVPPQIHLDPEMMRVFAHTLQTLFADCSADPKCRAAFPELEQDLYHLVAKLEQKAVQVRVRDTDQVVDGNRFMALLFEAFHYSQALPYLPCLISCTYDGDNRVLEIFLNAFPGRSGTQMPGVYDISEGMQYSVLCAEEVAYQTENEFQSAALEFDPSLRPIVLDDFHYFPRICETWSIPGGPEREELPVISNIPVLLLSGKYDPSTSHSWALLAAETLSHHYIYELPDTGHITYRTSNCSLEVIFSFINDPSSDPSRPCLEELRPPAFITSE